MKINKCSFSVQNWTQSNFTVQWTSLTLPHFLHSIRRQVSCAKPYFNWLVAISLHVSLVQKQSKYSVQIFFFCNSSKQIYLLTLPSPVHKDTVPKPKVIYCRALLYTQTLWHHATRASFAFMYIRNIFWKQLKCTTKPHKRVSLLTFTNKQPWM